MSTETFDFRKARACMVCGYLRTFDQFRSDGCPNCSFLELRGSTDRILDSTSSSFSGVVGMVKGRESWVARWQRMEGKVRGLYALRVMGRLPEDVVDICETKGIRPIVYISYQ